MPSIILASHGRITTRHGQILPGRKVSHRGVDQGHGNSSVRDLEIMAPAEGTIIAAGREGSYGLRFYIRHDDGMLTVLAHHAAHLVGVGARVSQGQIIARMGNTGTIYVHSHQELRDAKGVQVDPLKYVGTSTVAVQSAPIVITALPDPKEDEIMKIIRVEGGTIALIGEFTSAAYASASQGNAFSYGLNEKVFGTEIVTQDEAATLLREASNRRNGLVAEIAATIIASLRAVSGGLAGAVDVSAIARAVQDEQDRRERERLS